MDDTVEMEAVEGWRESLTENLREHRKQWHAFRLERASKEKLLAIAETSALRSGKYKPKVAGNGGREGTVDMGEVGKNNLKLRLGQIENEMQMLEAIIDEEVTELVSLPAPEDE